MEVDNLCVCVCVCVCSGSKLVPFWSWLQMGRDILFIRLRYTFGIWKLHHTAKVETTAKVKTN